MMRWFAGFCAAFGIAVSGVPANANGLSGIYIVSGSYGKSSVWHKMDITQRLQDLCGTGGASCDIWCSQSSFGGRDLGRHSLCRVIYRCPDGATRSGEAMRDEPILMRCPSADGEGTEFAAPAAAR